MSTKAIKLPVTLEPSVSRLMNYSADARSRKGPSVMRAFFTIPFAFSGQEFRGVLTLVANGLN